MKNNRAAQPINDLVLEAEDEIIAVTTSDEERILYEIFTGAI
jgi:hypothetical protein